MEIISQLKTVNAMACTDWGYPLQCCCLFCDIWWIGKCYWYFTPLLFLYVDCAASEGISTLISFKFVFFQKRIKGWIPKEFWQKLCTESISALKFCKKDLCFWQVSNDCFYLHLTLTCNYNLFVTCRSVDASFTCCYLKIMTTRDHTKQLGKLYPASECSASAQKPSGKYFLCNGPEYIAHNMVWLTLPSGSFTNESIRPFMNGPFGLPRMHWPNKSISIWRWDKHGLVLLVCAQTLQRCG